ncbi:hypothetical protein GINT2_002230 [Glugoides intestinalis]
MERKLDYVITCDKGCIPYVIDCEKAHFEKNRKLFIDDFLYKDSFYDKGFEEDIAKFIGGECKVVLGFKGNERTSKNRILVSKRGHYKINKLAYEKVIGQMKIASDNCASFENGDLFLEGEKIVEPRDLEEFNQGCFRVFGTDFINKMTEEGKLLIEEEGRLKAKHLNETEFEYEKYLFEIKEMIAFTFISEHNYKVLYEFVKQKKLPETNLFDNLQL